MIGCGVLTWISRAAWFTLTAETLTISMPHTARRL
jgi:hypothetical protein